MTYNSNPDKDRIGFKTNSKDIRDSPLIMTMDTNQCLKVTKLWSRLGLMLETKCKCIIKPSKRFDALYLIIISKSIQSSCVHGNSKTSIIDL